jgi:hypothetical protein
VDGADDIGSWCSLILVEEDADEDETEVEEFTRETLIPLLSAE